MTLRMLFIIFFDKIDSCYEITFPEKIIDPMFKRKPWMTKALMVFRKNKAKMFNKKLRKPSLTTINKFKKYNKCTPVL